MICGWNIHRFKIQLARPEPQVETNAMQQPASDSTGDTTSSSVDRAQNNHIILQLECQFRGFQ